MAVRGCIIALLVVVRLASAQPSPTPTGNALVSWFQPDDRPEIAAWSLWIDGRQHETIFRDINATPTPPPGTYTARLPWYVQPSQRQVFLRACPADSPTDCSALSNEWPTRSPTPLVVQVCLNQACAEFVAVTPTVTP